MKLTIKHRDSEQVFEGTIREVMAAYLMLNPGSACLEIDDGLLAFAERSTYVYAPLEKAHSE